MSNKKHADGLLEQSEIIALLSPLLKKYHAERALLFGSYARNEAVPESDIDVLVIGGEQFDPTDVFAIAEDLHELTGKAVDVYELREIDADSDFYRSIFREGVAVA